jgi:hypothetical protein
VPATPASTRNAEAPLEVGVGWQAEGFTVYLRDEHNLSLRTFHGAAMPLRCVQTSVRSNSSAGATRIPAGVR